jgi:7-cyano-7-deazaguanine reductase
MAKKSPAAKRSAPLHPKAAKAAKTRKAPAQTHIQVGKRERPPNPPTAPSKELHVFANPSAGRDYVIQFQIPEFTCLCPLTGQPDFAHFTIDMICDELCIELKSLKMYMWSYRDEGAFHEKVTNTILDDIVAAIDPRFVRITAKWYVRGGIYTNVIAEHRRKGWTPEPRVDLPVGAALTGATGLL